MLRRVLLPLLFLLAARPASAARLKELVDIEGFRGNHLVGMGIVVGLAGTGDDLTGLTIARRELTSMARHLGVVLNETDLKVRNIAAVSVTAMLPPFARPGMKLDVVVSSMGSAKSLQGGTLLVTPLKGADGSTWALAQGPITVGGFDVSGASGTSVRKNHVTVARVPGGAVIERELPFELPREAITLLLRDPDFTTASRIAAAIEKVTGKGSAIVRDPASVTVKVAPERREHLIDFVAALEAIEASPDSPAKVVIDERTGTIVVGAGVKLSPAAVAVGSLSVNVSERKAVSQPNAFASQGETKEVQESEVAVEEKPGKLKVVDAATTVGDVATALNALGVKPRDLVAVFQALRAAGALYAEIQVL